MAHEIKLYIVKMPSIQKGASKIRIIKYILAKSRAMLIYGIKIEQSKTKKPEALNIRYFLLNLENNIETMNPTIINSWVKYWKVSIELTQKRNREKATTKTVFY